MGGVNKNHQLLPNTEMLHRKGKSKSYKTTHQKGSETNKKKKKKKKKKRRKKNPKLSTKNLNSTTKQFRLPADHWATP